MTEELENIDSQNDEVEVETTEQEQTTEESTNDLTDREKQFLARAKKAEGKLKTVKSSFEEPKAEPLKTNTEQGGPTMEHVALFSKGFEMDEVKAIEEGAKVLGVSLLEASENDFVKAKVETLRNTKTVKANSLGASSGSAPAPRAKTVGNMTDAEHRAFAQDKLSGAINQ